MTAFRVQRPQYYRKPREVRFTSQCHMNYSYTHPVKTNIYSSLATLEISGFRLSVICIQVIT